MQITSLRIHNFKSIRNLELSDIENSLILVGKNNTGKTGVLEAVRAVFGTYQVAEADFNEKGQNIEIEMKLAFSKEDLSLLHKRGIVSQYKRYDSWFREFQSHLPSFHDGILAFTCIFNRNGEIRYNDGFKKQNRYIPEVLPRLYFIDTSRNLTPFQEDLLLFREDEQLIRLRSNLCMFDPAKTCNQCFSCIGLINQKQPTDLDLNETAKLLEYKMYQLNLHDFSHRVNENYIKNGGLEEIQYTLSCNTDSLFHVTAEAWHDERKRLSPVEDLGNGMKSIYMLSLLETYIEDEKQISSIIIVEYPELFLHPSLQ